jgi:hypothetical protein
MRGGPCPASGKSNVNVEPLPGSLSTSMSPPICLAISLEMVSPSPNPPLVVLRVSAVVAG